jgi:outer membrane protein TolC
MDPYLNVISAQTNLLSNQQTQVTLHVNEMTAAVELVQALGGGWNVSQLPSAGKITSSAAAKQVSTTP